jgi:hypothetical protein
LLLQHSAVDERELEDEVRGLPVSNLQRLTVLDVEPALVIPDAL